MGVPHLGEIRSVDSVDRHRLERAGSLGDLDITCEARLVRRRDLTGALPPRAEDEGS
jgi:hypothetical protein